MSIPPLLVTALSRPPTGPVPTPLPHSSQPPHPPTHSSRRLACMHRNTPCTVCIHASTARPQPRHSPSPALPKRGPHPLDTAPTNDFDAFRTEQRYRAAPPARLPPCPLLNCAPLHRRYRVSAHRRGERTRAAAPALLALLPQRPFEKIDPPCLFFPALHSALALNAARPTTPQR